MSKSNSRNPRSILLKSFSPEDLVNKNPDLHYRLYATFEPMGITHDLDGIQRLLNDYREWLAIEGDQLKQRAEARAALKAAKARLKEIQQDDRQSEA